jgi:hypothetical protein
MAFQLKVIAGTGKDMGRILDLPEKGSLLLGRGPETDSRFTDVRVSGSHCRIYAEGGRVSITDNGSTNGTFINERPLVPDELRDLFPGDVIRLGENTRMEVAGDDIAVMKTIAGDAGLLARAIAVEAAKQPLAPPPVHPIARRTPPQTPLPAARPTRPQPAEPTVEVTCTCQQRLVAREKYAGTRVRCPNCRNILHLPGRAALAQPVEEDEFLVPLPPDVPGNKWWSKALTFAAGALLLLAAGACFTSLFSASSKASDGSRGGSIEQVRRVEAP